MRLEHDDPRLMDYVLGELDEQEAAEIAAALKADENKEAKALVEELRGVADTTRRILHEESGAPSLSQAQRAAIVGQAEAAPENVVAGPARWWKGVPFWATVAATISVVAAIGIPNTQRYIVKSTDEMAAAEPAPPVGVALGQRLSRPYVSPEHMVPQHDARPGDSSRSRGQQMNAGGGGLQNVELDGSIRVRGNWYDYDDNLVDENGDAVATAKSRTQLGTKAEFTDDVSPYIEYDAYKSSGNTAPQTEANIVEARNRLNINANLRDGLSVSYETDGAYEKHSAPPTEEEQWSEYNVGNLTGQQELPRQMASHLPSDEVAPEPAPNPEQLPWNWNTPDPKNTQIVGGPGSETYVKVTGVKPFLETRAEPLSTFSIDVDTAAYSNVRRFLNRGQMPPPDAVRIEEMVNYFAYNYPQPTDHHPFAVAVHGAPAPWDPNHRLVRIGVKGKEVAAAERPPANLVFLLDVSGSMGDANKLPLVKESMKTLLSQLTTRDKVGIVTYSGNARKVLDLTPCSEHAVILRAIDSLRSGGSTNGGGGIQMAYDMAQAAYDPEGINRVIMATDGDFNVGNTTHGGLMGMIEARAKSGVFLTTLGFGMGNLKDSTLEQLADRGNGNYAYIDTHAEARKALGRQLSGTLHTIAKDVKIQVEFNPNRISHYRLLGYENRALANQDFNDDTKDAGEIGAGHTVTALYEIIPRGASMTPGVDPLKYSETGTPELEDKPTPAAEWLTVKMRYKQPSGSESTKLEVPLNYVNGDLRESDPDFRFAASVAAFGQVLRNPGYRHPNNFDRILELARPATGGDPEKEAFLDMVITAKTLATRR